MHRTLDLIPASNASRRGCLTTQRLSSIAPARARRASTRTALIYRLAWITYKPPTIGVSLTADRNSVDATIG